MGAASAALAGGFSDPVGQSQAVFRALMDAMARPGTVRPLPARLAPPAPLTPGLAAVALALADHEAALWLDAPLAAAPDVAAFLRFHTGAALVAERSEAAFALIADPAGLASPEGFALGTEEFPDRSTTLVLAVEAFEGGEALTLAGPGIARAARLAPTPQPAWLAQAVADNAALFPRGLDIVFASADAVAALPRSSRLIREA